jgi:hypothetical protein
MDLILLAQERFKPYYQEYPNAILPLACCPDLHKRYPDEPRNFDVAFLGNASYPHRRKYLEMIDQNFKLLRSNAQPGEPYSRLLNQADILFNCAMEQDVNMRFFEAISCGRLLISDFLKEQDQFAEAGKHYVAFDNKDDLIEKIKYYLDHPEERELIAKAGMEHIQVNHTYSIRLTQLICLLKTLKYLS